MLKRAIRKLYNKIQPFIKPVVSGCCMVIAVGAASWIMIADDPPPAQDTVTVDPPKDDLSRNRFGKAMVSIRVQDDNWSGTRVVSASLDGRSIRLRKRGGVFGLKGSLDTRLPPGDYMVRWTITKPAVGGQSITLSMKQPFHVDRYTNRVTVVINGQNATVY